MDVPPEFHIAPLFIYGFVAGLIACVILYGFRDGVLVWLFARRAFPGVVATPGGTGTLPLPIPLPAPLPLPPPVVPDPPPAPPPPVDRFLVCIPFTLIEEGGNDDDSRDPGGRTSRGIRQSPEWDLWRQTHPGLPSDVFKAPQDQILAIYREKYWEAMSCDKLPPGIDMAMFDFGVHSGIGKVSLLQQILGVDADGEIGPDTIAAAQKADPGKTVNALMDRRLAFLQSLKIWSTFAHDFTNRVAHIRAASLAMVLGNVGQPSPTAPTQPAGDPPWLTKARTYLGKTWWDGDPPQWMIDLIDGIKNNAANRNTPGFAAYCDSLKHGYRPWCGIFVAGCLAAAGLPVPFVQGNDLLSFAWAPSFDTYGTEVTDGGRAGDVHRYGWHGGGEHVTFKEGYYANDNLDHILGGNQGNAVNIKTEPMDDELKAARRPPAPTS